MGKKTSLSRRLAGLSESAPRDFDPEENGVAESSDEGSDSQESNDERSGTEHYVEVGKSKLRNREEVALGPQYAGTKVSRRTLEDTEYETPSSEYESAQDSMEVGGFPDPGIIDTDMEEGDGKVDSDEAFEKSDESKYEDFAFGGSETVAKVNGRFPNRKTAADFMLDNDDRDSVTRANSYGSSQDDMEGLDKNSGSSLNSEASSNSSDEEIIKHMSRTKGSTSDTSDADEDKNEEGSDSDDNSEVVDNDDDEKLRRAELRRIMSEDQKTVAATISQAVKADVEKGVAVKQQRKTFDSFLNVRIRLQKALVATNSMVVAEKENDNAALPYRAAEAAAIKLLSTLDAMQQELSDIDGDSKSGQKRKQTIELDTPSSEIWENIKDSESRAVGKRQSTLERWSSRVRGATALPLSSKLNNMATQQTITDVIQDQLSNAERLIKRTKIPRSCAPLQAKMKISEDPRIYDDADFYQLLLKELVDQRMADPSTHATLAALGSNGRPWAAAREAKTKKIVDTKASKGRKMRYTVHEKLQNFMAPEDRGSWEPEAIDRFFGSLLGQKISLGEKGSDGDGDGDGDDHDGDEGVQLAEEALMLFRSHI